MGKRLNHRRRLVKRYRRWIHLMREHMTQRVAATIEGGFNDGVTRKLVLSVVAFEMDNLIMPREFEPLLSPPCE